MPSTNPGADLKRRWDDLVAASDPEDLEAIELRGDTLARYVDRVAYIDRNAAIWPATMDPEDCRQKLMDLDRERRNLHNHCLAAVKGLNSMAVAKRLPPLFDGDVDDRYAVADFAGEFVNRCYEHGLTDRAHDRLAALIGAKTSP